MSSSRPVVVGDVSAVIHNAVTSQKLSPEAASIMVANLDPGNLTGFMGVGMDDLDDDDCTIVSMKLDVSSSMRRQFPAVAREYNRMLQRWASDPSTVLVSVGLFSDNTRTTTLHGFIPVERALADHTITPDVLARHAGTLTALHRATNDGITELVAHAQMLEQQGGNVKKVLVVITDGGDNDSGRVTASTVKDAMGGIAVHARELFTFAFAGIGDEGYFTRVAHTMGFEDGNIITEQGDLSGIFQQVSNSVSRISVGAVAPGVSSFFST